MNLIDGPVKYEDMGTLIQDKNHEIVCDIRGWGRLKNHKDGHAIQDSIGFFIAEAINEKIEREEALMSDAPNKCRVCGKETKVVFNIDFKAVPVCDSCAGKITMQNVKALVQDNAKRKDQTNSTTGT